VAYVPDRRDVAWIDFDPQVGREQAKRRPALVLSPKSYNRMSGLCLVCPVRSRSKGWPYDVPVTFNAIKGFIICDQVHSFDWQSRRIDYITALPARLFEEAQERMLTLIR
jgi:mRNA interferase MazF